MKGKGAGMVQSFGAWKRRATRQELDHDQLVKKAHLDSKRIGVNRKKTFLPLLDLKQTLKGK